MKIIKKYKYYILSFLIPLCVYLTLYWFIGFYFEKRYLPSDVYAQYVPTFKYLYNVLHGNSTFPYTLTKGIGGTMYGAFFYGLSSPLNLFVYFFEDVYLFVFLLTIFKLSLCGLTSFIYLRKNNNHSNIVILIFSLLYSFMGYNLVYGFNIMWLDSVFLAPLLLLAIDNFVNKDKHLGYIFLLFYIIISNYYTGYVMVVFSLIYFIYKLYINYNSNHFIKNNYKKILRFVLITVLIGCMTMFILIPVGIESLNFIRIDEKFKLINFNFFDIIAGNYIGMGNIVNPLNDHTILTYFTLAAIPLLINYFYTDKINKREKKGTIFVLICFLLPVIIPVLNRLWHMFTLPQLFNYRYSYLVVLFLIPLCLKSLDNISCNKKIYITFICIYLILSISLSYNVMKVPDYYKYLTIPKIVISGVILLIYILLLLNNKKKMVYLLIVMELIINISWIGIDSQKFSSHIIKKYTTMDNTQLSELCDKNVRCEKMINKENISLYNNYNGVSIFLSSTNKKSLEFLYFSSNLQSLIGNFFTYNHPDIFINDFLGIRYIDSKEKLNYYNLVDYDSKNDSYLYENENAFSLGFIVDSKIKKFKAEKGGIFFFRDLFNTMFNKKEDYVKNIDYTKISDTKYIIHVPEDIASIFIETDSPVINIDDNIISKDDYGVYYNVKKGNIELEFENDLNKIKIYSLDMASIAKIKEELIGLNIIENSGNYIKGEVSLDKDNTLFTTIPYELGWKVFVDGKEVKHYEAIDTFIAIDLKKGSHTIEFKYSQPGLKLGIIISLISMTILITYELKRRK